MRRRVYSRLAMAAIHERSAAELAAAYARGELSPLQVARALLERIEAWEPRINAMYRVQRESALEQARASESRWRSGRPLSALDGVPLTIKENIYTRGDPAPIGTRANEDAPLQPADAPPAARVREAGCVILGKTTMPDFGMLSSGLSSLHGDDAQSLAPGPQSVRLELGRRRRRCGGLCATAPRHRHRRLGSATRHPLRHLRAQAVAWPRAGAPALPRPRDRADDAHRRRCRAPHERRGAARCARLHEPACARARISQAANRSRQSGVSHRLPARHGRRARGPPGGQIRRRGGGHRARRRRLRRRIDALVPYRRNAGWHVSLLRGALLPRPHEPDAPASARRCCPSSPNGAAGAPRTSPAAT